MAPAESHKSCNRSKWALIVVSARGSINSQIREALKSLGCSNVVAAASHLQAIEKIRTNAYTHIVFDMQSTDMNPVDFVEKARELLRSAIFIGVATRPTVEDVFAHLRMGTRSFLVPPFNIDTLQEVLAHATDGPKMNSHFVEQTDRDLAFVTAALANLDRLAEASRMARKSTTAERDVQLSAAALQEIMYLANLFHERSDQEFQELLINCCLDRAEGAASRLGQVRQALRRERDEKAANAEVAEKSKK